MRSPAEEYASLFVPVMAAGGTAPLQCECAKTPLLQIDKEFLVGVGEVRGCLVVDRNLGHDVAGQGLCQIRSSGVTEHCSFNSIVLLRTAQIDVLFCASLSWIERCQAELGGGDDLTFE